jgi:hypothetical protein
VGVAAVQLTPRVQAIYLERRIGWCFALLTRGSRKRRLVGSAAIMKWQHGVCTCVAVMPHRFGPNTFPEPPFAGFWALFFESFQDTILQILILAAIVSFIIGLIEHPSGLLGCGAVRVRGACAPFAHERGKGCRCLVQYGGCRGRGVRFVVRRLD